MMLVILELQWNKGASFQHPNTHECGKKPQWGFHIIYFQIGIILKLVCLEMEFTQVNKWDLYINMLTKESLALEYHVDGEVFSDEIMQTPLGLYTKANLRSSHQVKKNGLRIMKLWSKWMQSDNKMDSMKLKLKINPIWLFQLCQCQLGVSLCREPNLVDYAGCFVSI